MKVQKKFDRIERLFKKLKVQDRSTDLYRDDLDYCFYECWCIKDWLKNDDYVIGICPDIRKKVEDHANANEFLILCADIANHEKHLELLYRNRVDGKISKTDIGIHCEEHITAVPSISIKFIPVNDLEKHSIKERQQEEDRPREQEIIDINDMSKTKHNYITQEYIVTNNKGEKFEAIFVLEKAVESWKSFVQTELGVKIT